MLSSVFSKAKSPANDEEENVVQVEIMDEEDDDDGAEEDMIERVNVHLHSQKSSSVARTWQEAHDQYCRKYGRLRATISEVLEDCRRSGKTKNNDDTEDEEWEAPWALPTKEQVVTSIDYDTLAVELSLSSNWKNDSSSTQEAASSSSSSAALNLAKRLARGIYSSVLYYTGQDEEVWQETTSADDDDAYQHASSSVATKKKMEENLDLKVPIVHVELIRQCLSSVLSLASSRSSLMTEPVSLSLFSFRKDPWTIIARSDWLRWLQQTTTTDPSLQRLSLEDAKWLLEVLVAHYHARILQREREGKPDLVVLRSDGKTLDNERKQQEEESLKIPVSLFDLQYSARSMEAQLEQWAHQVQVCSQKALVYKRQGQTRLAMAQLTKRKLLQQQIDNASSTLIQLEQVYASIETAQSNKTVLQLLSQGSQLMHQLSAETSLEAIDDLKDDVQEALDQVHQVHEGLVSLSSGATTSVTDDELLAELESLTIQDTDDSPSTTTTTTMEESSTKGDAPALTQTESASQQPIGASSWGGFAP